MLMVGMEPVTCVRSTNSKNVGCSLKMATDESKGAMCTYLYLSILAVNNVDGGDNGIEEK